MSRYLQWLCFGFHILEVRGYAQLLESRLPWGCLRCLYGADMVCSLANDPEYAAPDELLFVCSSPRLSLLQGKSVGGRLTLVPG